MKYLKKILCGLFCAALCVQATVPWMDAGMDTVRAEEGEASPQVQILRDGQGDMEPLIAVKISDEEAEQIRQEMRTEQKWYGTGDNMTEAFLACGSDYGYQDMAKRSSGGNRQYLYRQMDEMSRSFTLGQSSASEVDLGDTVCYAAGTVDLSGNPLTDDEKIQSYFMFRNDNPQYFWLSNMVVYSDSSLILLTYNTYRDGLVRDTAFREIQTTMEQVYLSEIDEGDSRYQKVRKIHDALIADVEYGETSDWEIAHSVAGAMTSSRMAVCEGYAKVMQLVMNYYDICNIYVTGYAGGPHAWNMVQMGDGQYYWLDATWDDQDQSIFQHQYFLVGNQNFADHTPDSPKGSDINFLYELPPVADYDYFAPLQAVIPNQMQIYTVPGAEGVIGYTLSPADTTEEAEVLFYSTAPEIVEINALTGEWVALQKGNASIVLDAGGGITAQCEIIVGDVIRGDVDGDGSPGIEDLRLILRYVCGKTEFTENQLEAGDVTGDGEVGIEDLRKVLRYVCGKIAVL